MLRAGGFAIKAYAHGWIVGKPQSHWSEADQKDVDNLIDRSYYTRLEHALMGLLDRSLRESARDSVAELRMELRAAKVQILEAIND